MCVNMKKIQKYAQFLSNVIFIKITNQLTKKTSKYFQSNILDLASHHSGFLQVFAFRKSV